MTLIQWLSNSNDILIFSPFLGLRKEKIICTIHNINNAFKRYSIEKKAVHEVTQEMIHKYTQKKKCYDRKEVS